MCRLFLTSLGTLVTVGWAFAQPTTCWIETLFNTPNVNYTQGVRAHDANGNLFFYSSQDLEIVNAFGVGRWLLNHSVQTPYVFPLPDSKFVVIMGNGLLLYDGGSTLLIDSWSIPSHPSYISQYATDPFNRIVVLNGPFPNGSFRFIRFDPASQTFTLPFQLAPPVSHPLNPGAKLCGETTILSSRNSNYDYSYTCFDNETGTQLWQVISPSGSQEYVSYFQPVSRDRSILLYRDNANWITSRLKCVNATGAIAWASVDHVNTESPSQMKLSTISNSIVTMEISGTAKIRCFSLLNGQLKGLLNYEYQYNPRVLFNELGDLFIYSFASGPRFECFDGQTMLLKWIKLPSDPGFSDFYIPRSEDNMPLVFEGTNMKRVNPTNGSIDWEKPILRPRPWSSQAKNHSLINGSSNVFVSQLDNSEFVVTIRDRSGTDISSRRISNYCAGSVYDAATSRLYVFYVVMGGPLRVQCLAVPNLNTVFDFDTGVSGFTFDYAYSHGGELRVCSSDGTTARFSKSDGSLIGVSSPVPYQTAYARRIDPQGNVLRMGYGNNQIQVSRDCFDSQQDWSNPLTFIPTKFAGFSSSNEFALLDGQQLKFYALSTGGYLRTITTGIPSNSVNSAMCYIFGDSSIVTFVESNQLVMIKRNSLTGAIVWERRIQQDPFLAYFAVSDALIVDEELLLFWSRGGYQRLVHLDWYSGELIEMSKIPLMGDSSYYNPSDLKWTYDSNAGRVISGATSNSFSTIGEISLDRIARWNLLNVNPGQLFGGSVASLQWDDSNSLIVLADEFESNTVTDLSGTVSGSSRTNCRFKFRSSSSHPALLAIYSAWNWNLSRYDMVSSQSLLTTESETTSLVLSKSTYMNSTTGNVKVQIFTIPTADISSVDGWIIQTDLAEFRVVP